MIHRQPRRIPAEVLDSVESNELDYARGKVSPGVYERDMKKVSCGRNSQTREKKSEEVSRRANQFGIV